MFENYQLQLEKAKIERKHNPIPHTIPVILLTLVGALGYIFLGVMLAPAHADASYHFGNERGAITVLSSLLLMMASTFSLASFLVFYRLSASGMWIWLLMGVGIAFLAFDDLLQFHARLGNLLSDFIFRGFFRTWSELVVILYGVIALPFLFFYFPTLLRFRLLPEMIFAGIIFYGIHTGLDIIQDEKSIPYVIIEESAKLYSAVFLALGTFFGFLGIIQKHIPQAES